MNAERMKMLSDVAILRKLFFGKDLPICLLGWEGEVEDFENNIFTPSISNNIFTTFILINFSNNSIDQYLQNPNCEGIVNFSNQKIKGSEGFYFFNNPDGTMRWVFSKKGRHPVFLNLYNGSGWKAKTFKIVTRTLFFLGGKKRIASGQFSIFSKKEKTIERHFGKINFDDFAIFTGTVGENRKAIIALSEKKECTQFVKIPMTKAAEALVKNEYEQLHNLSKQSFKYLIFPKTHQTETNVIVSNIRPDHFEKNTSFTSTHWKALHELYQNSNQKKSIGNLSFWKTIEDGIHFFRSGKSVENGLPKNIVTKLQKKCEAIFFNIDPTNQMNVGIGHGDFTPWNMYLTNGKLHLYDWEMCTPTMPLLFDVFHYFFQKGILIERKDIFEIEKDIQSALQMTDGKLIIDDFQLDWKKYYQIYMLYIVSYYLPKYRVQKQLHEQVHWLLDTWSDALELMEVKSIKPSGVE